MADAASEEIPAAKLATWPRNMITLLSEQNRPCAEIEEAFGCPRRWPACVRYDIANCPKSVGSRHRRPSCRQISMRVLRYSPRLSHPSRSTSVGRLRRQVLRRQIGYRFVTILSANGFREWAVQIS